MAVFFSLKNHLCHLKNHITIHTLSFTVICHRGNKYPPPPVRRTHTHTSMKKTKYSVPRVASPVPHHIVTGIRHNNILFGYLYYSTHLILIRMSSLDVRAPSPSLTLSLSYSFSLSSLSRSHFLALRMLLNRTPTILYVEPWLQRRISSTKKYNGKTHEGKPNWLWAWGGRRDGSTHMDSPTTENIETDTCLRGRRVTHNIHIIHSIGFLVQRFFFAYPNRPNVFRNAMPHVVDVYWWAHARPPLIHTDRDTQTNGDGWRRRQTDDERERERANTGDGGGCGG